MEHLTIGYAQSTITPSLARPVYLAGFGRNRVAQSVHDDLYVRALALRYGDTRLALAALDVIGLFRHHCLEVAERVTAQVPGARVILASTHTHHGPDTMGLWGPSYFKSGVDPVYMRELKDTLTATLVAALAAPQPANLRSAAVHVPGVAKNARDPNIVDDELTCLQFCAPDDGKPLVTVLIFPCHPETLWYDNPHITADYPGFLRAQVEAATGAPCLFFSGALGGMMTPDVQEHTFAAAERIGHTLAQAALTALSGVAPAPVDRLTHTREVYRIPLRNPLFKLSRLLGVLPREAVPGRTVMTEANLIKLGPVTLATAPGEVLPKLGLALKADLKQTGVAVAGVIGLANDELGYILPAEDFRYPRNPFKPGEHYEETMSIAKEAGSTLMQAWQELRVAS
ncbi:MAG TPA: hypothetical protein PKZ84_10545 [Anaerolineae bacterium]|nr:hypothetical protein [Anaerolineae bacterium]HQI85075.1 hypothetical protein [Anaerolineae bacterium]